MRRKDKEITDRALIEEILIESEVVRIAMVDNGEPYLVAMNYAYQDGIIYMHSAKEGRKIDVLKSNNRVAFQLDKDVSLVLCDDASRCTTSYLSVFGTGKAIFVDSNEEKRKALDLIMLKHTGKSDFEYPEKVLGMMFVIKIEIDVDSLTGKKS